MSPGRQKHPVGPQAAPCFPCTLGELPDVSQDKTLQAILSCSRSRGYLTVFSAGAEGNLYVRDAVNGAGGVGLTRLGT